MSEMMPLNMLICKSCCWACANYPVSPTDFHFENEGLAVPYGTC